ncbi:flavin reductase family protein [Shimia biformata]|uniref:flavin reductase family protein n=1 Tax=Shimia biformata TaxID=1294299 RepID=UPI00194FE5C8|nr:flavin reductase family protein [Shimia biformata]
MGTSFRPTPEHSTEYREALGCFATGVTIVTATAERTPIGMTANSFSSISLTPPLVLWSPSKTSLRYPYFAEARHFAIHVLREDQRPLAEEFARRGDAFDQLGWEWDQNGVPVFDDCLTRFDCRTTAIHEGGDHVIMVGEVENVVLNDGSPLVFARRSFGRYLPGA